MGSDNRRALPPRWLVTDIKVTDLRAVDDARPTAVTARDLASSPIGGHIIISIEAS